MHNINGFIGPVDELERLTTGIKNAKIVPLDVDGLGFLPRTDAILGEMKNGWYAFGEKAQVPLAHVETDYFGGAGDQSAAVWDKGQKVYRRKATGAINEALRQIGVKEAGGMDRFDTVGLGKYRTNEDWAEHGTEELERQEAIRVLDELAKGRET